MRILHVPHAYAPVRGGAELHCQRLSEVLTARGHQVRVVTVNAQSPEAYYRFGIAPVGPEWEVINGVEVVRLSLGWPYRLGGVLTPAFPSRLRSKVFSRLMATVHQRLTESISIEIERFHPDVVMTMPHLFINVRSVLEVHRRQPFPLVLVPLMHEFDPHWPFQELKEVLTDVDAVIANTDHEAGRLRSAYQVPADRVFTGGVGIDLPEKISYHPREPVVLYLGRKSLAKGLHLLIEAMRRVWEEKPEIQLVVAGTRVPDSVEVDHLIAKLPEPMRGRVRSLDDISEEEKGRWLSTSACVVLPSRIESFGLVLLEAWAHSTPVVALDLPVLHSVVDSGADGVLVSPEPASLAQGLLSLLTDPDRASAMGIKGRRKAERHTWDYVADRYLDAYRFAMATYQGA